MSDFGIIGIGRIGTSMARNMSSKGIIVSLFDKSHNSLDNLKNDYPELESSLVFNDINKFISSISKPRKVYEVLLSFSSHMLRGNSELPLYRPNT